MDWSRFRKEPFDWQAEIISDLADAYQQGRTHSAFWIPTGGGKTLLTQLAAATLTPLIERRTGRTPTTYVAMPDTVLLQWTSEASQVDPRIPVLNPTFLDVFLIRGTAEQRRNQFVMLQGLYATGNKPKYVIFSYETLRTHVTDLYHAIDQECDILVLDEAHKIQSEDSGRGLAALMLSRTHYRIVSSATMQYHKVDDLYAIVKFCDPYPHGWKQYDDDGDVLYELPVPARANEFGRKRDFLSRYATRMGNKITGLARGAELNERLDEFGFYMRSPKDIGLPEARKVLHELEMDATHRRVYDMQVDNFIAWRDAIGDSLWETEGVNAVQDYVLVLINAIRLAAALSPTQFAVHQVQNQMTRKGRQFTPATMTQSMLSDYNQKLTAMRAHMTKHYIDKRNPGGPIVYSQYKMALNALQAGMGELQAYLNMARFDGDVPKPEREMIRQGVASRRIRGLFMNGAGGEGLNLQQLNHVHVNDADWVATPWVQVVGRVDRFGQQEDTEFHIWYYANSIESIRMVPDALKNWNDANAVRDGKRGRQYAGGYSNLDELESWFRQ